MLIVAAGCSRRMKKFKPLLPLGSGCIIEHTISRFIEAGFSDIVVVVGHRREELIPVLNKLKVQIVINEEYDQTDMLESVKLGLRVMPADTRGVLLCPADIPMIDPETIKEIADTGKESDAFAIIPSFEGRRGHPILFGRRMVEEILKYRGENGIHGVLEKFENRIQHVVVKDENMLMDIDRPEDYEKLLEIWNRRE